MRKSKRAGKTGWGGLQGLPTAWARESKHKSGKHGEGFAIRASTPGIMKGRKKGRNAI